MSKDPAFIFYSGDFLTGTSFMTNEEVGCYIRLLCFQHQKGHIKEKDMNKICYSLDKDSEVFLKFIRDENGLFYNDRLDEEIKKRREYSESRAKNRKGKKKDMNNICNSYEKHMENENDNIDINNNNTINENNYKKSVSFIMQELNITSPFIADQIQCSIDMQGIDIVLYCVKIALKNGIKNWKYIEGILNNLGEAGIKTVAEAKEHDAKFKKNTEKNKLKTEIQKGVARNERKAQYGTIL